MPSVLVTGASRGIGRVTALRLAARGFDVTAGVRRAEDGESLQQDSAGRVRPVILDVTNHEHIDRLRQTVLPAIRAATGRIVFVSSLSGRISTPMTGAYNASKFALEALADALRIEVRPWRIPVVLVEPAQTDTDMWRTADQLLEESIAGLAPEHRDLYAKHIDGQRRSIPRSQKMAAPAEGVAAIVEKALTARRPKARYVVGAGPRIMGLVGRHLPPRVADPVFAAATGVPRRP